MSYAVTGIQANTGFTFPAADHASGGVTHSPLTTKTVDHATTQLSTTDTGIVSTPDKFKVASTPHATAPTASGIAAPVDTVTLSTVDKVRNLREQGEGDTLIATTLNLPIKEVDSDLHVSTQTPHLSFTVAPVVSSLSTGALADSAHLVSTDA